MGTIPRSLVNRWSKWCSPSVQVVKSLGFYWEMAAGGLATMREGLPERGGNTEDGHCQVTLPRGTFASFICKGVENNIYLTVLFCELSAKY